MHHARQALKDAGYRLTPQRVAIWEVARKDGRHLTAEQIAEEVQERLPEVSLSTVYRTLQVLVSLDLVSETRLDTKHSYYEVARNRSTTTLSARSAEQSVISRTGWWRPLPRSF